MKPFIVKSGSRGVGQVYNLNGLYFGRVECADRCFNLGGLYHTRGQAAEAVRKVAEKLLSASEVSRG